MDAVRGRESRKSGFHRRSGLGEEMSGAALEEACVCACVCVRVCVCVCPVHVPAGDFCVCLKDNSEVKKQQVILKPPVLSYLFSAVSGTHTHWLVY